MIQEIYHLHQSTTIIPRRRLQHLSGGPDVLYVKNPQSLKYNSLVEVSLDVILLSESQLIIENDGKRLQYLNNNFNSKNLKYLVIFNNSFKNPIYCLLTKNFELKIFINQSFKSNNEFNLRNLLISLLELSSEVIYEKINNEYPNEINDLKLIIYLKKNYFESESKILIKNLSWLGGKLKLNDSEDLNKYNDWYIMEFEI